MTILILGANGSGKSAFAERLAARQPSSGNLYYIATMVPFGDEGISRVERHRAQRADMGFVTLEQPHCVSDLEIAPGSTVLLEDVSNLLSNATFDFGFDGTRVFDDIAALCEKCCVCVLVSISGLAESPDYDAETNGYICSLNRLNARLSEFADSVVEMRDSVPVWLKGETYAVD